MSQTQLIKNFIVLEIKRLSEEKATIPPELAALTSRLELKFEQSDGVFRASKKISEKNSKEQRAFESKWQKMLATLSKRPWKKVNGEFAGWNGQTDTGGDFSSASRKFVHQTGLTVSVSDHTSFKTGTKSWSITARANS